MDHAKSRHVGFLLVFAATLLLAAEEIDQQIMKRFEFFSQMDVIENLDIASQFEALTGN